MTVELRGQGRASHLRSGLSRRICSCNPFRGKPAMSVQRIDVSHRIPGTADAVQAGDYLFVSTQLAWDENGTITHIGDFSSQLETAFQNLESVLSRVDGNLQN